jgi:hypothetical protein
MSRYALKKDCLGEAKENQKLQIGYSYTHGLESYNWIVGFSDINDNLVYVPEGTKLIGPDNKEYELKLEELRKINIYSEDKEVMAFLCGKEERFGGKREKYGLGTEVKISLENAMVLRFNNKRETFKVKQIGKSNQEETPKPSKKSLINRLLKRA